MTDQNLLEQQRVPEPYAERGDVRQSTPCHVNGHRHVELLGYREVLVERGVVGAEPGVLEAELTQAVDRSSLEQRADRVDAHARVSERERGDEACVPLDPLERSRQCKRAHDDRDDVSSVELCDHRVKYRGVRRERRRPVSCSDGVHMDVDDRLRSVL